MSDPVQTTSNPLQDWGLLVRNSKCFGSQFTGFEELKKVNVIVGQNNSGKSTLLELVASAAIGAQPKGRDGLPSEVRFRLPFDWDSVQSSSRSHSFETLEVLRQGHRVLAYANSFKFEASQECVAVRRQWREKHLNPYELKGDETPEVLSERERVNDQLEAVNNCLSRTLELANSNNPFAQMRVIRISAQRAYRSEGIKLDYDPNTALGSGGQLNQFIYWILHRSTDNLRQHIQKHMLSELNRILETEDRVDGLSTIHPDNSSGMTETVLCYNSTDKTGDVRLSECGTGLSTLCHVLISTMYLPNEMLEHERRARPSHGPNRDQKDKWINVFLFEELENNLHPSTLRRLFRFIEERAQRPENFFFLSTHSPVSIDYFASKPFAQILHVKKEEGSSKVTAITDLVDGKIVVDDLGHRASDVLQSNCVVWVEGLSDIMYFHKWIEIWTNGELKSGIHFLCLPFYGTGNLGYISVDGGDPTVEDDTDDDEDEPDSARALMSLIHVNRNVIFFADRDCDDPNRIEKARVEEVHKEVIKIGGLGWITKGREVENYVPASILNKAFVGKLSKSGKTVQLSNEFVDIPTLLKDSYGLTKKKTAIARKTLPHWDRAAIESSLDLKDRLDEVVKFIRRCNHLN